MSDRQKLVRGYGAVGVLLTMALLGTVDRERPVPQDTRFGFGRPATAAEIAALDIDVKPDGTGLPDGRGTVEDGRRVYAQKCLACHGPTGTEGPNNRLVGRVPNDAFPFATDGSIPLTIGNYWPYASTVFDYVRRSMPFDRPGSLEANEVYGLVALLLFWNEIIPETAVMDRTTLPDAW